MKNKTWIFDGMKAVDIWGDDPTGWTIYSGEGRDTTDAAFYKFIPTLFRAVQLRAYQVSTMPFQIMKGEKVYDICKRCMEKPCRKVGSPGIISNPRDSVVKVHQYTSQPTEADNAKCAIGA